MLDPTWFERPRAHLENIDVQRVLQYWGIPGKLLETKDLGGSYNANIRATTTRADVVLRVRQPWVTVKRVRDVHHILYRLSEWDINTPLPRMTRAGGTYAHFDSRLVEVFDYLPEEVNRRWCDNRWHASFQHLGHLHNALLSVGHDLTPPLVSNYARLELSFVMLGHTRARLEELPPSSNRREALAICDYAEVTLHKIAAFWDENHFNLPFQLIHGDFHLDNLLFDDADNVAYVIDFDFLGWRERVYELAYALRMALPQLTDNHDGMLNGDLVAQWLNAYNRAVQNPLTLDEYETLPYQMAQVALFYICDAGRLRNPLWRVLREAHYVELAGFLVDHPQSFNHTYAWN